LKCSKSIRMVCLQTIPRQWAPLLRLVRSIQTQSSQSKPLYCTDYLRSPRYVNSFLSRRHFSLLVLSFSATNLNRLYPQATTVSRLNARNVRIPLKFEFSNTFYRKISCECVHYSQAVCRCLFENRISFARPLRINLQVSAFYSAWVHLQRRDSGGPLTIGLQVEPAVYEYLERKIGALKRYLFKTHLGKLCVATGWTKRPTW